MKRILWLTAVLVATASPAAWCDPAGASAKLARYGADATQVTVSGLSSGAYLAVQYAVAYSSKIKGVGVFAGGPYRCVGGVFGPTVVQCMSGDPRAQASVEKADALASAGLIDDTAHLKSMRAYVAWGELDQQVGPAVAQATFRFFAHYNKAGATLAVFPGLAHGIPVERGAGVACGVTQAPYVNDCGADGAARMLDWLYRVRTPVAAPPAREAIAFDQTEFVPLWRRSAASMDELGYVYVPQRCERGRTRCRVHVALHGCHQGVEETRAFVERTGYRGWADRNAAIVLFPQAIKSTPGPLTWWGAMNPEGCWDWWGYSGSDYAQRSGVQIEAIRAMVERVTGKPQ
jgi:poly(3-hydroxybutyrate) depolymerase